MKPALVVHGGCGTPPPGEEGPRNAACERAADAGWRVLQQGGSALDGAEATVRASQARLINARESLALADENLKTDRQRADAALTAAQARMQDSRAKADRTRELLGKKLASLEEAETADTAAAQAAAEAENAATGIEELKNQARTLEQARQQIRIAEAQVDNDQVSLDLARQRLTETRVVSPVDGVVTQRAVQIGQIISSGISNVGGGTTALVVSDLSRIFVLAAVDESDIGQVRPGQRVKVTVDAHRNREFTGEVVRISPRGVNVSNVVTFEVKIEVTARDKELLRPEMTANVEVLIDERPDALLAPSDAIFRRGGKTWVSLQAADGAKTDREVNAGISDGRRTEILSGLTVGETVLVQGTDSKWNGQGQRPGGPPMMRLH